MDYHKISLTSFDSKSILDEMKLHPSEHIIIDALACDCSIENISSLKQIIKQRNENGSFFGLLNTTIDIDELEDEINIAPTLQEAMDMIEMEVMMRDL